MYRKEAEVRRQAEAEEQARRAEQRRREAEALRKLQERSKAPWAQAPRAPAPAAHASLAEIQRLEREKKAVSAPSLPPLSLSFLFWLIRTCSRFFSLYIKIRELHRKSNGCSNWCNNNWRNRKQ